MIFCNEKNDFWLIKKSNIIGLMALFTCKFHLIDSNLLKFSDFDFILIFALFTYVQKINIEKFEQRFII
jgi:hypothetical protein